ncbi:peptide chain release factor 1 [Clonorchis sinensis]|uniref:Peptide chain release factor 1 n=1 Tax=Clonorchis sinensis TaxID=79923 RepID=G7Y4M9_CLOSI|nr:peptide chain release factor 1 [Clonorchis sinensis]
MTVFSLGRYIVRTPQHWSRLSKLSRFTHSVAGSPLFSWLPKELEPKFLSYKKHLFAEYEHLTNLIANGAGQQSNAKDLASRWNQLRPIVDVLEELDVILETDAEAARLVSDILNDGGDGDVADEERELVELARVEQEQRAVHRQALEQKLLDLIVPEDPTYFSSGVTLEIIAGAGGREAGLFARELLEMYRLLCVDRGWHFALVQELTMVGDDIVSTGSESPLSKACLEIVGEPNPIATDARRFGAYGQLRWEAGVHRVQRVPVTSKQGKIHTSTVAVSVIPSSDKISIDLPERDLSWAFFRASGAGGQHVNRTDSAVRLTHIPTGTVVTCQQERSQHANKRIALGMLRERLVNSKVKSQTESERSLRRCQIGHLDRSEKVRTYNYPQDRITDHRLSRSWAGIFRFMRQTTGLSEAIQAFVQRDQSLRLHNLLSQTQSFNEGQSTA